MRAHRPAEMQTIVFKFGRNPTICLREEAIFVRSQKCPYRVTFDLDLDPEHTLDASSPGDHHIILYFSINFYFLSIFNQLLFYFVRACVCQASIKRTCVILCKFGARRSDFRASTSARITWPLTLTLTLSTSWMRSHLVTIVCKFGRNRAICLVCDLRKKFTLGQTDRRTDKRRTPRHYISSWNGLKMEHSKVTDLCRKRELKGLAPVT